MTKARVEIRPIKDEERGAAFEIWRRAVAATHDFLSPEDAASIAELVKEQYTPHADLLVADRSGAVAGFMGMSALHIDSLFVHPDHFGCGVGRAFVEFARRRGAPVTVDVNEQNSGAIAFYERLGFVTVRRAPVDNAGRPYPLLFMEDRAP